MATSAQMRPTVEHQAQPPAIPAPTRELLTARAKSDAHRRQQNAIERRSMVRGLLILAAIILILSITRAGLDRTFVPGWWHQW